MIFRHFEDSVHYFPLEFVPKTEPQKKIRGILRIFFFFSVGHFSDVTFGSVNFGPTVCTGGISWKHSPFYNGDGKKNGDRILPPLEEKNIAFHSVVVIATPNRRKKNEENEAEIGSERQ